MVLGGVAIGFLAFRSYLGAARGEGTGAVLVLVLGVLVFGGGSVLYIRGAD